MQQAVKGNFDVFNASNYKVGIVVAQFNRDVTDPMLESALLMLKKYQVPQENVTVAKVPGSVEIPVILKKMAESKKYDCLVAIGAVIRGASVHFDYVCKMISEGVMEVMMDTGIPVGFGVLTANDRDQAEARISAGGEATEAALQTAKVLKTI